MSGDVQPRKRKDKKKKRGDDESSHGVHIAKMGNDDVHLHVQHEHGTGGHWCAKIIFFALMAILLGIVGLIILENRGFSDLDTPLSESRFSNYFDGWVDEHRPDDHGHDVVEATSSIEEYEDENDNDDETDDGNDDEDVEAEAAEAASTSWVSSQIKPKENLAGGGGGPQAQSVDSDTFERDLRQANEELMRENHAAALKLYTVLCDQHPDQPLAFLGKAHALDRLADEEQSNKRLADALEAYKRFLAFDELFTDNAGFRAAAERCIERMHFMGFTAHALTVHEQLVERFANEAWPRNQLAVTYLLLNRLSDASAILQKTLRRWPEDGFAHAHYGFVLKQLGQDYVNAIVHLRRGISSQAEGTQDGRFYFSLGDALQRLGRQTEAVQVYASGAQLGLFPSVYQRSLYNEPRLRAQPFWSKEETGYAAFFNRLERQWLAIRAESESLLGQRGFFQDETENLRAQGEWQQYNLYARGERLHEKCQRAPITCSLVADFEAASGCRRGQVKFSVMHPGTHVWPHCGPTNCRLRAHLGLIVPPGTRIRVAEEERTWREGDFLIFDDSFEHEVWHAGTSPRLVLIVDVWHPDLTQEQRHSLPSI